MKTPGAFLMWRMVHFCCKDAWLFPTIVWDASICGVCAQSSLTHLLPAAWSGQRLCSALASAGPKVLPWEACSLAQRESNKGLLMALLPPVRNSFCVRIFIIHSCHHCWVLVTVAVWTVYRVFYLWMLIFLWRLSTKYITSLLIEGLEWLHKRKGS